MAKIKALVEITTAKDGKSTTFHPGKEYNATATQLEGLVKDLHYTEVAESKDEAATGKGAKGAKGAEGAKEDEV